MRHPLVATRLYNTPLLIDPLKASIIERIFRSHQAADESLRPGAWDDDAPRGPERTESAHLGTLVRRPEKLYDMTASGIAVIPVTGTLVQRTGSMQPYSGFTPYAYIGRKLQVAAEDSDVRGILLEFDSYGGEVNGCFELAAQIVGARSAKPLWGHANEVAYSAAYALACSCTKLYTPNTGGLGSIGVIALHIDQSKYDARMGDAYTYIYFGDHKKDANPHEPLSDAAYQHLKAEIDRLGMIFCTHVANARDIEVESVIATQAATLNPEESFESSFSDGIKSFAETIEAMEAEIDPYKRSGSVFMSSKTQSNSTQENEMTEQEKIEAAKAEGVKEGVAKGKADERARIAGILSHANAKNRGAVAQTLALETDMTVDEAGKVMAASPEAQLANPLAAAMKDVKNPAVGAADDQPAVTATVIDTAGIYASRAAAEAGR